MRTFQVKLNLHRTTCFTSRWMKQKSGSTMKPIIIKGDTTTTENLKNLKGVEDYLEFIKQFLPTVAVQDLSRRLDEASGIEWSADKVISRFHEGPNPEEWPPINLLDLDCFESNVVPRCFNAEPMQFLSKLKACAGRPVEDLTSPWAKVEKWCILGQAKSGTLPHHDHCGLSTVVIVVEGVKLWGMCDLSAEDWKCFANEGAAFTGGRWFYDWLKNGDILIMPPETVHAVWTPVNTLCVGGNAWSQRFMGNTMRSIAREVAHPKVTNDEQVPQLRGLLERVHR